jgi:hypothetical protein
MNENPHQDDDVCFDVRMTYSDLNDERPDQEWCHFHAPRAEASVVRKLVQSLEMTYGNQDSY